ncbi:MAG TPA: methionyl-tRNA formyltransferase, partial [Terriglobales bacterium]|nr:methionyl-tRNA formyltransferase [Terriglobales bacterium]
MALRLVFFGTPQFAVPSLQALLASHQVVGVVCQPDRPAGRGQHLTPPPVKEVATAAAIPIFQPEKLRQPAVIEQLQQWAPEAIIVVAYGKILPRAILDLPRLGCINVHASLLPKYRGAAPIQWAIYHGEPTTGVTIMHINERMDAGDMLLQRSTAIGSQETYGELQQHLATIGAQALIETIDGLIAGKITPTAQDEAQATYAPLVTKENGRIDWNASAVQIERMIRAFQPWPSAYTGLDGKRLQIHRAEVAAADAAGAAAGTVIAVDEAIAIACGEGVLRAHELQLEGRRRLPAAEIARAGVLRVGSRLG